MPSERGFQQMRSSLYCHQSSDNIPVILTPAAVMSRPSSLPRPPSLSQKVVEGITERVVSGQLPPGARVPPEPVLMREFGVSRSVVREAVSRLQANGVVRTRHGIGSFVLSPPAAAPLMAVPDEAGLATQQKLAMLELRLSLESGAAALAAQRRSEDQLAQMERALADFEAQMSTGEVTAEADFRFHELIAQATGNEYFVQVLRSLTGATIPRQAQRAPRGKPAPPRRFGEPSPLLRPSKDITAQEHRAVLDAIRAGDAQTARAAMFMHLNNSRERMKRAGG